MHKKLQVEAIRNGTVIDHIPAGQGIRIVNRVQKLNDQAPMTVGLNLPSKNQSAKDLVKVDNWLFSEEQAYELALYAPQATINIISEYKVVKKFKMSLPNELVDLFACPNTNCITHSEPVDTRFRVNAEKENISLRCHYCERSFDSKLFN